MFFSCEYASINRQLYEYTEKLLRLCNTLKYMYLLTISAYNQKNHRF